MKKRLSLITLCILSISLPVFADKVGVAFEGDDALTASIAESLKVDGHEIVDIAEAAAGVKMASVTAASIGKATGVEVIVSGKKLGAVIILKVLSAKNDTVIGGTANDDASAIDQVKKLLVDNKEKLSQ